MTRDLSDEERAWRRTVDWYLDWLAERTSGERGAWYDYLRQEPFDYSRRASDGNGRECDGAYGAPYWSRDHYLGAGPRAPPPVDLDTAIVRLFESYRILDELFGRQAAYPSRGAPKEGDHSQYTDRTTK